MPNIDDRKSRILQAIIEDYVATAEPVGSRTIARRYHLGVSPATIRNEMSDLEELGFLEQPHTSAGRVPSDRGYRYYVDCLMGHSDVGPREEEVIRRTFERKIREIDILMRETARLLSDTTHYTSVVIGPQSERSTFREVQLVPMAGDRALLIYSTDRGFSENQVIEMPLEFTMLELQRVSNVLNEHLRGQPLEALTRTTISQLREELHRYGHLLEQALEFLSMELEPGQRQRIFLGGTTNILAQPEFRDLDKVRGLLNVLEQDDMVVDAVGNPGDQAKGVSVSIGEEIKVREMHECSMVTATYRIGDRTVGRLGVLGPKRMEYSKVVALVGEVAEHLNDTIERNLK